MEGKILGGNNKYKHDIGILASCDMPQCITPGNAG